MRGRLPSLILFVCGMASAQSLLDAGRAGPLFDTGSTAAPLECGVKPVAPALNFGLRFQAGYLVRFPLKQFTGRGHKIHVLVRVTPEGKPPVFLTDSVSLPNVPQTQMSAVISGSVLIGEGNYRAAARIEDEQHRLCRAEWSMHARRDRAEQALTPAMAPGEVAALSSTAVTRALAPDSHHMGRLTVLLHAAPMRMRSTVLQPSDIQRLTGALAAVLERVPASSVRLVLFNVDQQTQLLRRDRFEAADFDVVTKALNGLQSGTVDYKALRNPKGGAAMFAGIVSAELRDSHDRDAVVVLGPEARTRARLPESMVTKPDWSGAGLYYFHFLPRAIAPPPSSDLPSMRGGGGTRGGVAPGSGGRGGPGRAGRGGTSGDAGFGAPVPPDTIQRVIKRLNGSVVAVRTPQDFARAVARINSAK